MVAPLHQEHAPAQKALRPDPARVLGLTGQRAICPTSNISNTMADNYVACVDARQSCRAERRGEDEMGTSGCRNQALLRIGRGQIDPGPGGSQVPPRQDAPCGRRVLPVAAPHARGPHLNHQPYTLWHSDAVGPLDFSLSQPPAPAEGEIEVRILLTSKAWLFVNPCGPWQICPDLDSLRATFHRVIRAHKAKPQGNWIPISSRNGLSVWSRRFVCNSEELRSRS